MDRYRVSQGDALPIEVVLENGSGQPTTGLTGSETLSTTVWAAWAQQASGTATTAFIDPSAASISIIVGQSLTAQLAPGTYRLRTTLTTGGTPLEAYEAELLIEATPGAVPSAVSTPTFTTTSAPTLLSQVYCTDEDLLIRASQDFANLCPKSQLLAWGTDGVFASGSPWVLTSSGTDFKALGVAGGCVLTIVRPASAIRVPGGEHLVVDSVASNAVRLRRPGKAAGVGLPPAPSTGLASVEFRILTYGPQIDVASYDANKFFGIDPANKAKAPTLLYDPRELQQFTVLTVLRRAYIAAEKAATGDYKLKLADVSTELEQLRARLIVHWGSVAGVNPPSSYFSARTRR